MLQKITEKYAWIPVLLLTVVFSLKNLSEPDIWWQIAAGDLMLNTQRFLYTDPFSFTFPDAPWMNIKWGYEIMLALFVRVCSPEMLPVLQAVISCFIIYLLVKTSRLFIDRENHTSDVIAGMAGLLLFLLVSEYRMNTRPEMFSHLFTAFFIYLLTQYDISGHAKRLWWLIPVQMVWANVHDGYVVGLVLVFMFLLVHWFRYFTGQVERRPLRITGVFAGMVAATCCNPYGYKLLLRGVHIFNQVKETKYTTEFLDYSSYLFWTKESYIAICVFIFVFLFYLFWLFRHTRITFEWSYVVSVVQHELMMPLLLMGSFTLLALMAYRNIVFLAIICTPHFIHVTEYLVNRMSKKVLPVLLRSMWVLFLFTYISVVSQQYYPNTGSRNRFGLEVSAYSHPYATAQYLKAHPVNGKVFSDYLNSSYFLWALRPGFKSFIDLRDYEVYTPAFFDTYAEATASPEAFRNLDRAYQFEAVVLLTRQSLPLHRFLYHDSVFHLTHLDAVCAVYERRKPEKDVVFTAAADWPQGTASGFINHVFNPFYAVYQEDEELQSERAAAFYTSVGDDAAAWEHISRISMQGAHPDIASEWRGIHYRNRFERDTSGTAFAYLDSATDCFRQALKVNPERTGAWAGLGSVNYARGLYKAAIGCWENALKQDQNNLQIHLYLADSYEKLAATENSKENYLSEIRHLLEANRLNPENPFIETDLGFIYARLNMCNDAIPYLEKIKNFEGLSVEDRNTAKQYLIDCRSR